MPNIKVQRPLHLGTETAKGIVKFLERSAFPKEKIPQIMVHLQNPDTKFLQQHNTLILALENLHNKSSKTPEEATLFKYMENFFHVQILRSIPNHTIPAPTLPEPLS